MQSSYIIGLGSYVPEKILSNQELETIVETSDAWILARTGMRERRMAAHGEDTSTMGAKAAECALRNAGVQPEQIQLIIFATMTPDLPCPPSAGFVQSSLGCANAGTFDLQAACSGFVYALSCARAFVESNIYQHILIICSEKMSAVVDYTDRDTCVLFGDGAAACVVGNQPKGWRVLDGQLGSDGSGWEHLAIRSGGSRHPTSAMTLKERSHFLKMNGKEVFKHAVRRMGQVSEECIAKCRLEKGEIDWLVCHQANWRIMEAVAQRLQMPINKVVRNIERLGNTSAASIPLALAELQDDERLKGGDIALLSAFGAGFNWGAIAMRYIGQGGECNKA